VTRELERVADEVGHLEDLRSLVVVGEDDRVLLDLELPDLFDESFDLAAALLVVDGLLTERAELLEQLFRGLRCACRRRHVAR
jgi:hypothetical protein